MREKDGAGHRRNPNPETVFLISQILHLPGKLVKLADQLLGPFPEEAALGRQNQAPALVPEQIDLKFALQIPDGTGHRRLGNMQKLRRAADALELTDRQELL